MLLIVAGLTACGNAAPAQTAQQPANVVTASSTVAAVQPPAVEATQAPAATAPQATGTPQVIQIPTMMAEKDARTGVQQKIASSLLYTIQQRQGGAADTQQLATGVDVDANGRTEVDITATVSDGLLANLKTVGAEIVYTNAQFRSIRAHVPLAQLETIAAYPEVIFIQPKQDATFRSGNVAQPTPGTPAPVK